MTDHRVIYVRDPSLVVVNGHEASICRNLTLRTDTLQCTCGTIGPTRKWRWSETQITKDWRAHAGDIAVGRDFVHGIAGQGCHCAACSLADRAAAGDSMALASVADIRSRREARSDAR